MGNDPILTDRKTIFLLAPVENSWGNESSSKVLVENETSSSMQTAFPRSSMPRLRIAKLAGSLVEHLAFPIHNGLERPS